MRNCIFSCLGGRKSGGKQITIPSKDQDHHGAYEIIKPIKEITVEGEKTKEPIVNTHREKLDHRQNQVTKVETKSDFEYKNKETETCLKEKNNNKHEPEQNQIQNHQESHSDSSSISSLFSYPISNRYKTSFTLMSRRGTAKEKTVKSDPIYRNRLVNTDDDHGFVEQESSDSLFSISLNSTKLSDPGEKEVNSPMKVCKLPKKEIGTIKSNYCVKINSITKPIENVTKSIMVDEQEDKENMKSSKQKLYFSDEIKIIGAKISSLLNPIENLKIPFSCQEDSFKSNNNSLRFSETKAIEVLVDTSLSSWLVKSERERDSPKSVKNSPDRGNDLLGKYNDDDNQIEKDNKSMLIPQARTRRLRA